VATDQLGKLKNAFHQRLGLRYTLQPYSEREMRIIVSNRAAEIGILLSPQAATRIAEAARGIPRRARHILGSIHTCVTDTDATITKTMANEFLAALGIDGDNLNDNDRRFLVAVAQRDGTSLQALALQLGLDEMTIRRDVEASLMKRGLVDIGKSGRCLTDAGKAYVERRKLV
jgi:Holliday junction resolvasome RuvABC ATP-dependent DNA helicase subunit